MKSFRCNCGPFRRLVIKHAGISSSVVRVAFLVSTSFVALSMFSGFAGCAPDPTTPPPPTHVRPTSTSTLAPIPPPDDTPTPIASHTPAPTLFPPVTLIEPEDDSCLECRSDVTLRWHCPYALQEDESYQLRVEGPDSALVYRERDDYTLNALSTGQYNWAVTVVRSQGPGQYVAVSEESETYRFEIAPPAPVVHSISPTSTVQGVSVPIVISGENFTHSLVITIGVSLQTTFVNSSTLTATVPITLETGEYPVVVGDSTGESVPTVSFVVKSHPPMPTPGVLPTPRPPTYPPPELTALEIIGCNVTFRWSWPRELTENEYYAVRYGIGGPGHSMAWVKERWHIARLKEPGEYAWEIAICQGERGADICNQLAVSEQQTFKFRGCDR